ncbi:uncharacterized protein LOC110006492 [Amborella trichopoda]|nr:uncharacterized protein LOC110006492 [Amborella trichopoda]|eukprot:XP_020517730.1 uncharacterized protein LOC110006492 [Amborella trichopoda]
METPYPMEIMESKTSSWGLAILLRPQSEEEEKLQSYYSEILRNLIMPCWGNKEMACSRYMVSIRSDPIFRLFPRHSLTNDLVLMHIVFKVKTYVGRGGIGSETRDGKRSNRVWPWKIAIPLDVLVLRDSAKGFIYFLIDKFIGMDIPQKIIASVVCQVMVQLRVTSKDFACSHLEPAIDVALEVFLYVEIE